MAKSTKNKITDIIIGIHILCEDVGEAKSQIWNNVYNLLTAESA